MCPCATLSPRPGAGSSAESARATPASALQRVARALKSAPKAVGLGAVHAAPFRHHDVTRCARRVPPAPSRAVEQRDASPTPPGRPSSATRQPFPTTQSAPALAGLHHRLQRLRPASSCDRAVGSEVRHCRAGAAKTEGTQPRVHGGGTLRGFAHGGSAAGKAGVAHAEAP